MGTALPALHVNPPQDPTAGIERMVSLQSLLAQRSLAQQTQRLQLQETQRKLNEQQAFRESYSKAAQANPSATQSDLIDATVKDLSKNPSVSPDTLQALQLHSQTLRQKTSEADDAALKLRATQVDNMRGAFKPIYDLPADTPPEQLEAAYQRQKALVLQSPQAYGVTDPNVLPATFPGKHVGDMWMTSMTGEANQIKEAQGQREAAKTEAETRKATAEAGVQEATLKSLQSGGGVTGTNLEEQEARSWLSQPQNKGKTLADYQRYKAGLVPTITNVIQSQGAPATPLNPRQEATVNAILEGRQTAPSSFAQKSPYWQNIMGEVYKRDPQWSEQRAQLRKSYTQDKEIGAINTALGHVGTLNDAIDALKNNNVQVLNRIANAIGVQTGATPVTTWNTIVHRVGPEIAKAYIGAGGSAGERGADEKDFDPALGPDQLRSNTAITAQLLRSKISSKAFQWDQNKSDSMPSFEDRFIMPAAKDTLNKLNPQGESGKGKIRARDPQGVLHEAPAGTALPKGWKLEK